MRHRPLTGALAIALLAVVLPAAHGQESITLEIDKKAELVDGGRAVDLTVEVSCPPGLEALEAFAYVVQDGNESDFGFFPLVCDGTSRQYVVRARAFDDGPAFRRGKARATLVVILEDPQTGDLVSAEESRRIKQR